MTSHGPEWSLSESAPARPDEAGGRSGNTDAAVYLLYQEVQRWKQQALFNQHRLDQLNEQLSEVNGKLLAHGRAEEIMRRAVGGNGVGDVPKPKHRRPCPKGWRVIDGGAKAAVPALVALAAVGVVLLVIAGGAVAVPSMRDGYSAQAATRPHLRPLVHPSHFATASPPPLPPVRTRHCHDREGDLHAVLLADERRACRDDDAAQDAREAAAGKAAPRPSPAATVTPSRSGTPAPPSPSPAPTLPQTSPAAVPPPAPTPSATPVDPGAPDDGQ